jgi:hypothetical protein
LRAVLTLLAAIGLVQMQRGTAARRRKVSIAGQ